MLFPKKAVGVEICSEGIKMALVEGRHNAFRLDAYTASSLPVDTIKFAFREQNVLNPSQFVNGIKEAYLRLLTKTKRISVSLPDTTGRVVLLDIETRFKSRDEGADIIRWKLKKNFPFNISDAHLDYQLVEEKDTRTHSIILNHTRDKDTISVERFEELLGRKIDVDVPYNPLVSEAADLGAPLVLKNGGYRADLDKVIEIITGVNSHKNQAPFLTKIAKKIMGR